LYLSLIGGESFAKHKYFIRIPYATLLFCVNISLSLHLAVPLFCKYLPKHDGQYRLTICGQPAIVPPQSYIMALIQRGGGTGPTKPRQPGVVEAKMLTTA